MTACKIVVVGDTAVGKTCLLISYTTNTFPEEYVPTVFDDYAANIEVDGEILNVGFWDTAGAEEYARLRVLAYPDTDIFLMCFAIGDENSLESCTNTWKPEIEQHCPTAAHVLVGTKSDLRKSGAKCVPVTAGNEMAKKTGALKYMECSALNQDGLKDTMTFALRQVLKKKTKATASTKRRTCYLQ
eukprot:TRINITY_DN7043_c0_g1_i2.p1 TRINITY_DN7043_c0_g1~~TRINITY_DN7043_c0_g1_i2.p1  ORF type:complete len:197 (-),score=27.38 TRINITY_DN7043_c0_g1_i2:292-849(-)